jgi:hypothetical protein
MPAIQGVVDFNPYEDIPSLNGKVVFVTGGTYLTTPSERSILTFQQELRASVLRLSSYWPRTTLSISIFQVVVKSLAET